MSVNARKSELRASLATGCQALQQDAQPREARVGFQARLHSIGGEKFGKLAEPIEALQRFKRSGARRLAEPELVSVTEHHVSLKALAVRPYELDLVSQGERTAALTEPVPSREQRQVARRPFKLVDDLGEPVVPAGLLVSQPPVLAQLLLKPTAPAVVAL